MAKKWYEVTDAEAAASIRASDRARRKKTREKATRVNKIGVRPIGEETGFFDSAEFERKLEAKKLDLTQFRGVVRSGGFASVHLVAAGNVFQMEAVPHRAVAGKKGTQDAMEERVSRMVLVTTRERRVQNFRNPRPALALLHGMGVKEVQVELASWRPMMKGDRTRHRPDLAELLFFAHEYGRAVTEPDTAV